MNELIEIVETEERSEKNTDELTKKAPYHETLQNFSHLFWLIVFYLVEGCQMYWKSYRIRNYEGAYFSFGLTIGVLIFISLLLLTFRQCRKIIDWKYRSKIFPPFGTEEIIMAVLSLVTLYASHFTSEEDLIKICGWKCPLRSLLSGMTIGFCFGWASNLCMNFVGSTLKRKYFSSWYPKYYTLSFPIVCKRISTARNLV
ncbi:uncharacterized protein LOC130666189 [Microplitis mediator]|uniref:uncharacterized protein LOC130666189 n=1 Tax=Microplitis mediator TaxID=375433 RepID=UPI0025537B98|nr:uncharacterized protein LOC130666189 [Microplitis mediator]